MSCCCVDVALMDLGLMVRIIGTEDAHRRIDALVNAGRLIIDGSSRTRLRYPGTAAHSPIG